MAAAAEAAPTATLPHRTICSYSNCHVGALCGEAPLTVLQMQVSFSLNGDSQLAIISSPSRSRSTGSRTPQGRTGTRMMPGLPGWCEERTATRVKALTSLMVAGLRGHMLNGMTA